MGNHRRIRFDSGNNSSILDMLAPWPSGKARVCKTLISGPNPLGASFESRFLGENGILSLYKKRLRRFADGDA
jgi:hypothetical protein